jgi:hypothetical protein
MPDRLPVGGHMEISVTMMEVKPFEASYGMDEKRYVFSEWKEHTDKTMGELFRLCRREYGRCVSKVYRDIAMGDGTYNTTTDGWVFLKRAEYTDCKKTYLQETWVSRIK